MKLGDEYAEVDRLHSSADVPWQVKDLAPVVPVRLVGFDKVLHQKAKMATPGPAQVIFGAPIRLEGDDYAALARQVEDAVRRLA